MKKLLPWFAALALLAVIFGSIYGVTQQAQRRDANYPQIQIAEDTARALDARDPFAPIDSTRIDINKSLASFTIVYDKRGRLVSGTGFLNNKVAKAPLSMLKASDGKEYSAVTWQPQADTRIAAVTVAAKDYYVLSGRNLREVEKNESTTLQLSLLGGIAALVLFGMVFILSGIAEEY